PRRPPADRVEREGGGGAPGRGGHHRQPKHRPVRRATPDGRVRVPCGNAGDDHARARRGRLPRGRCDHLRRARGRCRRRRPRGTCGCSRGASSALRRSSGLPGLPRGGHVNTSTDPGAIRTGLVTEVTHPLVQHKLGLLRDVTTTTQMFRQLVNELTLLLTYEATKDLADEEVEIETPLEHMAARRISGKKVAVCPILRAGMGMLDAVLSLVPGARVGFIGLFRDEETLEPVEYYVKLPDDLPERDVILLDPMLATGNSTAAAIETVKRAGAT